MRRPTVCAAFTRLSARLIWARPWHSVMLPERAMRRLSGSSNGVGPESSACDSRGWCGLPGPGGGRACQGIHQSGRDCEGILRLQPHRRASRPPESGYTNQPRHCTCRRTSRAASVPKASARIAVSRQGVNSASAVGDVMTQQNQSAAEAARSASLHARLRTSGNRGFVPQSGLASNSVRELNSVGASERPLLLPDHLMNRT